MNANLIALFDLYEDAFFSHEAIYAGYDDGLISEAEADAIINAVDHEVRDQEKPYEINPMDMVNHMPEGAVISLVDDGILYYLIFPVIPADAKLEDFGPILND